MGECGTGPRHARRQHHQVRAPEYTASLTHIGRHARFNAPMGYAVIVAAHGTSLDHCDPSAYVWVRPVQSSRKLCMKLYTAAAIAL